MYEKVRSAAVTIILLGSVFGLISLSAGNVDPRFSPSVRTAQPSGLSLPTNPIGPSRTAPSFWLDDLNDETGIEDKNNVVVKGGTASLIANELTPGENTVGLWHFNEGKGLTAVDSGANELHGDIEEARWWDGKFGRALNFNGTGNSVDCGSDPVLDITDEISVEGWFNASVGGWKFKRPIELSPETPSRYSQVRVRLGPSDLDYEKAKEDGSDVRFVDEYGRSLDFWIQNWNEEGASVIWVNVTTKETGRIHMYYGNPEAESRSLRWSGSMILMFRDVPNGWSRFTPLDNRFPRGSAVYGGTGGSETHNHTLKGKTTEPLKTRTEEIYRTNDKDRTWPTEDHTHSYLGRTDDIKTLPPYLNMVYGNTTNMPISLEKQTYAIFDTASLPLDWKRFGDMDDRFPRGAEVYGGKGGIEKHKHKFSGKTGVSQRNYTDKVLRDQWPKRDENINWPKPDHTHDFEGETTDANNIPPYLNVVFGETQKEVQLPEGMIAIFDSLPPMGWDRFAALDNRFPRGNGDYGAKGGSATHKHSFDCYTTGSLHNANERIKGDEFDNRDRDFTPPDHKHTIKGDTLEASNLPPYLDVIFGKKIEPGVKAVVGSETPTGVSKPGSYGIGADGSSAVGSINNNTVSAQTSPGWNHVALAYNGSELLLYVNGERKVSKEVTGEISVSSSPLVIGDRFSGVIDEVAIYDKALSPAEIKDHASIYLRSGSLRSRKITPPAGKIWMGAEINALVPQNTSLNITVHDPDTHRLLPADSPREDDMDLDLSTLSLLTTPSVYLRAEFGSDGSATPVMYDWKITWSNISSPNLIEEIGTVEVTEENPERGILDLSGYFRDAYNESTDLDYALGSVSDTENISLSVRGALLDVDHLADNFTGSVFATVTCTNIYGKSVTSNEFRIVVANVNDPPIASLISPRDKTTVNRGNVTFQWSVLDADDDTDDITFDLYLSESHSPELYQSDVKGGSFNIPALQEGATYHWYVKPKDKASVGICEGGTWSFTINSTVVVPLVTLLSPANGTVLNTTDVDLIWETSNSTRSVEGNGSSLSYRVLWGDKRENLKALDETEKNRYTISGLADKRTYYWKVIPSTPELEGRCLSGVWSFSVEKDFRPVYTLNWSVDKRPLRSIQGRPLTFNLTVNNTGNNVNTVQVSAAFEMPNNVFFNNTRLALSQGASGRVAVNVLTYGLDLGIHNLILRLDHQGGRETILLPLNITGGTTNGISDDTGGVDDDDTPDNPPGPASGYDIFGPDPWLLIVLGVLFLVLILVVVVAVLKKRRRAGRGTELEEDGEDLEGAGEKRKDAPTDGDGEAPAAKAGESEIIDAEIVHVPSLGKKAATGTGAGPGAEGGYAHPPGVVTSDPTRYKIKRAEPGRKKKKATTPPPPPDLAEDTKELGGGFDFSKLFIPGPQGSSTADIKEAAGATAHDEGADELLALPPARYLDVEEEDKKIPIDEIFLMTTSGLLVQHYSLQRESGLNEDILASMLSAVKSFMEDSLSSLEKESGDKDLNRIDFGKYSVLTASGSTLSLVAITDHDDKESVLDQLYESLGVLEGRYGEDMKDWDGDMSKVEGLKLYIEALVKGDIEEDAIKELEGGKISPDEVTPALPESTGSDHLPRPGGSQTPDSSGLEGPDSKGTVADGTPAKGRADMEGDKKEKVEGAEETAKGPGEKPRNGDILSSLDDLTIKGESAKDASEPAKAPAVAPEPAALPAPPEQDGETLSLPPGPPEEDSSAPSDQPSDDAPGEPPDPSPPDN